MKYFINTLSTILLLTGWTHSVSAASKKEIHPRQYVFDGGFSHKSKEMTLKTANGNVQEDSTKTQWFVSGGKNFGHFQAGAGYLNTHEKDGNQTKAHFKGPYVFGQINLVKNTGTKHWIPAVGVKWGKLSGELTGIKEFDVDYREYYLEIQFIPKKQGSFSVFAQTSVGTVESDDIKAPGFNSMEAREVSYSFGAKKYFGSFKDLFKVANF